MIDVGAPRTGYLRFGETIRMEARLAGCAELPFGVIEQTVVKG